MAAAPRYVTGDATDPQGEGPRGIVHVCNDVGGWGRGFVMAVSRRWPEPEERYRRWHEQGHDAGVAFGLGQVQFVDVGPATWVANLAGQHGLRAVKGVPPIRYDAVRDGLAEVATFAKRHGASVHMPRIGAGLAGGDWNRIAKTVQEQLCGVGVDVMVYDLPKA